MRSPRVARAVSAHMFHSVNVARRSTNPWLTMVAIRVTTSSPTCADRIGRPGSRVRAPRR